MTASIFDIGTLIIHASDICGDSPTQAKSLHHTLAQK